MSPEVLGAIIGAIALIIATIITIYFTIRSKNTSDNINTSHIPQISYDQIISIIKIHQNSVSSEIMKKVTTFFLNVQSKGRDITEEDVFELKQEVAALLKERRDILREFNLPKERLDQYMARIYDIQIEQDYERLRKIALSDMSLSEKSERMQEAIRQIQVNLLQRADREIGKMFPRNRRK